MILVIVYYPQCTAGTGWGGGEREEMEGRHTRLGPWQGEECLLGTQLVGCR